MQPNSIMQAMVYLGPGQVRWQAHPRPVLQHSTDALVQITATTLCGTDLHVLAGDVPTVQPGTVMGHEGVGIVVAVGTEVTRVAPGDRVVIGIISACGRCDRCRHGRPAHCRTGGWQLGNTIDGTQAEYVRVPFADLGLQRLPANLPDATAVLLSCALPTALECAAQAGKVKPGDVVAIVGAGPVGLACLLAVQLSSPAAVYVVDRDPHRLALATALGATAVIHSPDTEPVAAIVALTGGEGANVVIEAVGTPETFDLCQAVVGIGGRIANVGVHGKPAQLRLDKLWSQDVTLTTRLVDGHTTSRLLDLLQTGRLAPERLISHHLPLTDLPRAYELFGHAAAERVVKVVLQAEGNG